MAEEIISKRCSKCKDGKPLTEFHKDRRSKDGYKQWCKSCRKAYKQSEKGKAAAKRYQQSEKGQAAQKHYHQSEKGGATKKRYDQSKKGRVCNKRHQKKYRQTKKYKVARRRYANSKQGKLKKRLRGKKYKVTFPEQIKAQTAVNHAIRAGKLPRPDTLQCSCGEQAKQYHHHKGYEPKFWLDVIPVCMKCHSKFPNLIASA